MILSVHHTAPNELLRSDLLRSHSKGCYKSRYTFENDWTISVVAGPEDSGLYGVISEDTFEVAVIRPNGNMLDDVIPYQTPVQITSLMHLIEML
jgi:hypothetical protein